MYVYIQSEPGLWTVGFGEMSPKGKTEINHVNARNFIASCVDAIKASNNGKDYGTEAAFLEAAKIENW